MLRVGKDKTKGKYTRRGHRIRRKEETMGRGQERLPRAGRGREFNDQQEEVRGSCDISRVRVRRGEKMWEVRGEGVRGKRG